MPIPNELSATWPGQAEPDAVDFDIISAAHAGYGVASGCACTPASSGSTLGVAVASGIVYVAGATPIAVTGATVTPGTASGSNPRYDLIAVSNAGALSVVAGTAAASPVFPAIPASRTILAAVYIPTSATSITANNIIDKRQMVIYQPAYGTTSTTAASGDHLHPGEYASTLHATTHSSSGSDPVAGLYDFTATSGSAAIDWAAQETEPSLASSDHVLKLSVLWRSWRPFLGVLSADRAGLIGTLPAGPAQLWFCQPNTGTTLASAMLAFGSATTMAGTGTPTCSHPTPTNALGYRTRFTTAATANSDWAVNTTTAIYARGDGALPWNGYFFHARIAFPDASYNNTTATTGSRFFCGLTDVAAIGSSGTAITFTDDPGTCNRHGFQRINVNAGKTQTNFFMTVKNTVNNTESLNDTGIALTQNHVYDFFVFMRPNGSYAFGEVRDLTAGTSSGSMIDFSNTQVPASTVYMRAMVGLKTVNAVARNVDVLRIGCEVPA